jgi:hypothetical protein
MMIELVLFIIAVAIGVVIAKVLNHAGARGTLPAPLQRSYERQQRVEAARRAPVAVERERHRVRV